MFLSFSAARRRSSRFGRTAFALLVPFAALAFATRPIAAGAGLKHLHASAGSAARGGMLRRGRSEPRIRAEGSTVVINRRAVIHFKIANGDTEPEERAQIVAERLRALLKDGGSAETLHAEQHGKRWQVTAGEDTVLFYATRADARRAGCTAEELAGRWIADIHAALALPAITMRTERLLIPLGETRSFHVGGWCDGDLETKLTPLSDSGPCAKLEVHHREITVVAQQVGDARLTASVEDNDISCEIAVRKRAGAVPTGLTAEVTGAPASRILITDVVEEALRRAKTEPGVQIRLMGAVRSRRAIGPGEGADFTVPVRLEGAEYIPVEGEARVHVTDLDLSPKAATRLFYSNSPEHISRLQTLYSAVLTGDAPARIMFHHDNKLDISVIMSVTLANPSDSDLRLQFIPGFTEAGERPHHVGYMAGRAYWHNWMRRQGEILTLPARSVLPLFLQRLGPGRTSSGIAQIRLINPPPNAACTLRVASEQPDATGFPDEAANHLDAWRYASPIALSAQPKALPNRPQRTYVAARTLDAQYVCGKHWCFIPVGLPSKDHGDHNEDWTGNEGNYGVLYNINVTVQNPLPKAQEVEVCFESNGGAVMGVFDIGGDYHEVDELDAGNERSLEKITLQPGETRVLNIQTVPLGGSTYPANVIVR
jgi:hypothetical protein